MVTNQELNLKLAKLVYPDARVTERGKLYIKRPLSHGRSFLVPDYCNNWNDLMPHVIKNEFTLNCWGDYWESTIWSTKVYRGEDAEPQVALVKCLIKVLESKNE